MSQMLIGVDLSFRSHHVHFMHGEGHTLAGFSVSNDTEGAKYLQKLARNSYRLDKMMSNPINLSLSVILSTIRHMESQIIRLDKEIDWMMKGITQTLTSVKVIGPVYAGGLLAEIGDIKRFKDHQALAKFAGLVWTHYQSGELEAENTGRMRTGSKYLRYCLAQVADAIRKHEAKYKAFYQKKCKEVTKHQHKRALVLTARKLLRTNQLYMPQERGE
ncbi:transposase [Sporosarcina siberiensis]|uniref:Transposase n=1 Tax=Sporosarcina siberiensis TaxID=1365606 RepID=A0ABW4SD83_9BACL